MSDILTAPPAADAIAPAGGINFSPDAVASMRASWVAAGHPAEAFDVAAGLAEPSPITPAPDPAAPEAKPPVQTETWTKGRLDQMARDLIAAGVPEDQVRSAVEADGGELDLTPDTRTEEEITFDRLYPKPDPGVYRPDYIGQLPADTSAAVVQEFDTAARQWAASMDLSPEVGGHVIGEALRLGQALGAASERERAEYIAAQRYLFERVSGGPEAAADRMAAAGRLLAQAPKAFTDALKASGALDSAEIVTLLASEAERLAIRG